MNFNQIIEPFLSSDVIKATKYMTPLHVVKARRKLYRGRIDSRAKTIDIVLTIGRPNYAEKQFIKKCLASNESFPVKKVQLKFITNKKEPYHHA